MVQSVAGRLRQPPRRAEEELRRNTQAVWTRSRASASTKVNELDDGRSYCLRWHPLQLRSRKRTEDEVVHVFAELLGHFTSWRSLGSLSHWIREFLQCGAVGKGIPVSMTNTPLCIGR